MTPAISQAADDLIVACEVSDRKTYEKKFRKPEWPGERSGLTVGIGYDLGYATAEKVHSDWTGLLPAEMIDAMTRCVGVTGESAHGLLSRVHDSIDVPWNAAIHVYEHVDIPEWTARVCRAIPGADKLRPDCLGSLTSLAYNRGASFTTTGDRYREMRAIRSHIIAGELALVDDEIRNMKRLWPNTRGLLIRRDREADLWNKGLSSTASPPEPKSKPSEAPAPLANPPGGGGSVSGSTGSIGTTAAAAKAVHSGFGPWVIGGIIVAGVAITVGAIAYERYRNSQPIVARAKG